MSKVKMAKFFHMEKKIGSGNSVTLTLIGHNTKGKRVEVEIENAPTYMICHLASQCSQAIRQIRDNLNRELKIIREDADGDRQ